MIRDLTENDHLTGKELLISSLLAMVIGIVIGLVDTIFGEGLIILSKIRVAYLPYLLPFLGIAGLCIVFVYQTFERRAAKGMGLIFEVGQGQKDNIPLVLVPLIMMTTWVTHLFGGAAGREGVAVQLGATLSYHLSRIFSIGVNTRLFVTLGMAAGFAGLFQTPIAAIFFALEVLFVGHLSLAFLLPVSLASFVAAATSHRLGLEKFTHIISSDLPLDGMIFVKFAVLGILFGIVGNCFAIFLSFTKVKMAELVKNPYHRILIIGIVLSVLLWIAHQGRYSGLGTNLIDFSFTGGDIKSYDWLLKMILTVLTLSLGFQGGEVTPLFSIGASLGVVLGGIFNLPIELVAASGYIAVFGSATNTFLAPIFIGGEVFGFEHLPYYFIAVIFSSVVNRKKSIYAGQKVVVIEC